MGEEADADWQDGLVEWGIEEAQKFAETPFTRQFKKDCEALRKRLSALATLPARYPLAKKPAKETRVMPTTFHIRVNGGPEQTIMVETGVYRDAAAAVPALLGLNLPIDVEIWAPHLLPEYGPYHYRVRQNEFVGLVTEFLIPPN